MTEKREGGRDLTLHLAILVGVITVITYLPALRNGFVVWDDDIYVYNNLRIRSLDWSFIRWAFTDISLSHWRPLVWISHAIDYAMWGMNPMGHHLTSILLHGVNTLLVVYLISRLAEAANTMSVRSAGTHLLDRRDVLLMAGVTGILFGIHPLHVESVAWVTERKDVLYSLFFLLSISGYIAYADRSSERISSRVKAGAAFTDRRYLLSLVFFMFALASKPMAVTLPFVLLIFDWYPFRRTSSLKGLGVVLYEKFPFMAFSLLISIVTVLAQKKTTAVLLVDSVSVPGRFLAAFRSLVLYLWQMAVPVDLVPFYPIDRNISLLSFTYFGPVILVIGITIICIMLARKQRVFLAAWGWYVVLLLPVLGVVRVGDYSMADRYTYLPSIGPFMLIGLLVARGKARADAPGTRGAVVKGFAAVAGVALCLALSYSTVKQIAVWKDSVTLWSYVIEKEPRGLAFAYNNRGVAFRAMGQYDRALADYDQALSIDPRSFRAYTNRGIVLAETGQLQRAIEDFDAAISIDPSYADAYTSRGLARYEIGQSSAALQDFEEALAIDPRSIDAYLNRGVVFEQMGQLERALEDYAKVILLDPSDYLAYCNRGIIFGKMGQTDKALRDYDAALSLKPDFIKAYLERGALYRKTGNRERAISDYQNACDLGSEAGCEAVRTNTGG